MTKNQNDYWNLVELQRHNAESERLGYLTLQETKRHDLADEGIKSENNLIGWQNSNESIRHAKAVEQETMRHDKQQEALDLQKNIINKVHYEKQDQVNIFNAQENAKHNRFTEAISRSSIRETEKHNRISEELTLKDLLRKDLEYQESVRSHLANESINWNSNEIRMGELNESIRHNVANENIGWYNATETGRHNKASEALTELYNREVARHDLRSEEISDKQTQDQIRWHDMQNDIDRRQLNLDWAKTGQDIVESESRVEKNQADTAKSEASTTQIEKQNKWFGVDKAFGIINNVLGAGASAINSAVNGMSKFVSLY